MTDLYKFTAEEFEKQFGTIHHGGFVLLDGNLSYVPIKSRTCMVDIENKGFDHTKPIRVELAVGTKVVDVGALLKSIDHPPTPLHVEAILYHLDTMDKNGDIDV